MLTRLRLIGAFSALLTAVIGGTVGWRSAPPAPTGGGTVQLRSTALPMETPETTMKSPIVATTDPRPFDACEDIPLDVVQRLPGLTAAELAGLTIALPADRLAAGVAGGIFDWRA